jgi:hypothetical protein
MSGKSAARGGPVHSATFLGYQAGRTTGTTHPGGSHFHFVDDSGVFLKIFKKKKSPGKHCLPGPGMAPLT